MGLRGGVPLCPRTPARVLPVQSQLQLTDFVLPFHGSLCWFGGGRGDKSLSRP